MATPVERYRPSSLPFPKFCGDRYAPATRFAGQQRRLINFKNRAWASARLSARTCALRPTDEDGVFSVHYCAHRIASLDLRLNRGRGPWTWWTTLKRVVHRVHRPTTATANHLFVMKKCVNHVSNRLFTLSPVQISPLRGRVGEGFGVNRGNVADWHAESGDCHPTDQFLQNDGTAMMA